MGKPTRRVRPFYLNDKDQFYWEICRNGKVHLHLSRQLDTDGETENRWEAENVVALLNILVGAKAAKGSK